MWPPQRPKVLLKLYGSIAPPRGRRRDFQLEERQMVLEFRRAFAFFLECGVLML